MIGRIIVERLNGYVGGVITTSEISMAKTFRIAKTSLTNSKNSNLYTGVQTDISVSVSFSTNSYNFTTNKLNRIWYWNKLSTMEKIRYNKRTIFNTIDLYINYTWDVLNYEEKAEKIKNLYPDNKVSYDAATEKKDIIIKNTKTILIDKKGLNKNSS